MDAMPLGGTITTSAEWREAENEFLITVRDEGLGIAPECLERIFSPFFSTKSVALSTSPAGTTTRGPSSSSSDPPPLPSVASTVPLPCFDTGLVGPGRGPSLLLSLTSLAVLAAGAAATHPLV